MIAALDLVVTTDTSVAHVAGALGKPVWLLDRYNACWRWRLDPQRSPWYPALTISASSHSSTGARRSPRYSPNSPGSSPASGNCPEPPRLPNADAT